MTAAPNAGPGREVLFGLAFLVIATAVTLGLGEVVTRIIASRRLIYNIEMVKYATDLKMRDPLGEVSHVHRPSAAARLMGVDVALNSLGDRGPELANPKSPARKRVFVLGSSVTLGWGVPFDSTFTARTETMLNTRRPFGPAVSFEFLNAGIGNYNTAFQYRLFERQYPAVKPDLVVLNYFISDVQPRTLGRNSLLLKHSFLLATLFDRWSQLTLRFNGEYKDLFTFYKNLYADDSEPWRQTQRQVLAMRDRTAKDSVPFVVMIIPDIHDLSPGTPYKALYDRIEAAFTDKGITSLNTFEAFQRQFGDDVTKLWIQGDDPHPNGKGHALMADALYTYLDAADPLALRSAGHVPQPTR
jgi:hypothetical protein